MTGADHGAAVRGRQANERADASGVASSAPVVTLADQIACVAREIAMRERVYPKWVEAKRMTQERADTEMQAMRATLRTLEWLRANEGRIKRRVDIITSVEREAAFRAALEAFPDAELTQVSETGERNDATDGND